MNPYGSYDPEIMGRVLRQARQARGMSQEVLSGLATLSRSHLAGIETGRITPGADTLWRLAQALDQPLSELIRRVEAQAGPKR